MMIDNNYHIELKSPESPHIYQLIDERFQKGEYRILKFDGEMVIYRDFGNGFNIEISRTNTEKEDDLARIFLWLNKRIIAKIVYDVKQSDIGSVTEELREFSEELIRTGRNNWQGIYALRQSN